VREPDFQSAPFRVAVLHIPPVGSTWHGTKEIAEKFLPLLNEAGIDIMLCGHLHNYQLINKGDDKNVNFPILVNDDETYLDVTADDKKIDVFRKDLSGKIVDSHSIKRQH
ncbi:MAG: purple acid phosphatase, partial [Petrimonas sp.]|nr:purple acid phosphatase [Petrimonas sp.]MEA5064171.1 purple acid phosphatase [Petrimonas sp.]